MPREISDHHLTDADKQLHIHATDEAGPGGASHEYVLFFLGANGSTVDTNISFQYGPIGNSGPNGVTNESLLAVVIDRLRSFQDGPFKCKENEDALAACNEALSRLQDRTRDRIQREVEGKEEA